MGLIFAACFGLVVGALARLFYPGRQDMSILKTMLLGIGGGFVAGLIGRMVGWYPAGPGGRPHRLRPRRHAPDLGLRQDAVERLSGTGTLAGAPSRRPPHKASSSRSTSSVDRELLHMRRAQVSARGRLGCSRRVRRRPPVRRLRRRVPPSSLPRQIPRIA